MHTSLVIATHVHLHSLLSSSQGYFALVHALFHPVINEHVCEHMHTRIHTYTHFQQFLLCVTFHQLPGISLGRQTFCLFPGHSFQVFFFLGHSLLASLSTRGTNGRPFVRALVECLFFRWPLICDNTLLRDWRAGWPLCSPLCRV